MGNSIEWNINDAYIEHLESGEKYASFTSNPLHVVGYSSPVDLIIEFDELKSYIHTCPVNDDWIPYVTSYYNDSWGFCMSKSMMDSLKIGKYKVKIDSSKKKGVLEMSHTLYVGIFDEVFVFICHPAMANNGQVDQLCSHYFSMCLITILSRECLQIFVGSRNYWFYSHLDRHIDELRDHLRLDLSLSCVGDEREYSYIQSPYADTLADPALKSALVGYENVKSYTSVSTNVTVRLMFAFPVATFVESLERIRSTTQVQIYQIA